MMLLAMAIAVGTAPMPDVLVFSKTAGFRHGSIEAGAEAIATMAKGKWSLVLSEDSNVFKPQTLEQFEVVIFLNTTLNVLDDQQQAAFEAWLRGGGGWVGIHAAADTEYDWPFYGDMLGRAWFAGHPDVQEATIAVEDASHPAMAHLQPTWTRTDEWYNFATSPRTDVHVLASVEETSYEGGSMGSDHPIVWTVPIDDGVAFYTGLGHTIESWAEPAYLSHVAGAIDWASNHGWISLDQLDRDWAPHVGWTEVSGIELKDGAIVVVPETGLGGGEVFLSAGHGKSRDLVSTAVFGDMELHLEFMVPAAGNSGVYVQGRYEIQILDTAGKTNLKAGDCGGVYQRWDEARDPKGFEGRPPRVNAAKPAGQWQSYDIVFRAPTFNSDGNKLTNARLERVVHNGVMIHEDLELTGPTRGGREPEVAQGPIRLQGDHGAIAYRNIRVRRLPAL
jgi:type 1 glutamine amidotransferase